MIKFFLSFVPLLGTSIGSVLGISNILNQKLKIEGNLLISVTTGILASINVSLLLEASAFMGETRGIKSLTIGIILGIAFIAIMNHFSHSAVNSKRYKLFWAMLIHNIPEGVVVGVGFLNSNIMTSLPIMISISLQDIPDGMVVSMPFKPIIGKKKAFVAGFLSGIVEPIAAILVMLIFKDSVTLEIFEPYLIGFSISTISLISFDLLKECSNKLVAIITASLGIFLLIWF